MAPGDWLLEFHFEPLFFSQEGVEIVEIAHFEGHGVRRGGKGRRKLGP